MGIVSNLRIAVADTDDDEYKPEDDKLLLPSELSEMDRQRLGYGLVEKERKIRESEANDALHQVCSIRSFVVDMTIF